MNTLRVICVPSLVHGCKINCWGRTKLLAGRTFPNHIFYFSIHVRPSDITLGLHLAYSCSGIYCISVSSLIVLGYTLLVLVMDIGSYYILINVHVSFPFLWYKYLEYCFYQNILLLVNCTWWQKWDWYLMAIAYDYNLLLPSQSQMMVMLEETFWTLSCSWGLNTEADER